MKAIPDKYKPKEQETQWRETWKANQVYSWDPTRPREETFIVDTPPPTVSGSLHIGHVFSYTHQDLLARYQRMKGKNLCYPMGWDDNGLPTERRVQNLFRITCNPHLPYDPDWKAEKKGAKQPVQEVSRQNFIEACGIVTHEDEAAFEDLWRSLGLSIDWDLQYATIDEHCRKISQASFLEMVEKGFAYSIEAPTMWDVDFQTAVAQAEVEDKNRPGHFHDIRFQVEGGGDFIITTTRPEMLPACIAVVAHPDDERYKPLFGKNAITPLFKAKVPILPAEHADPEKGSGILMVCTFGDAADVEFWKHSGLPIKQIIGRAGTLLPVEFGQGDFSSEDPELAQRNYAELAGLGVAKAKKRIVELLAAEVSDGASPLVSEPRPIEHPVKFYEKGDRPLEFVTTRQWFVKLLEHRDALREQGRKIQWHPAHMETRYQNWVEGLNQDWCVSRQRYFGVPFPVWYPTDANGEAVYDKPIFAQAASLPVDPMSATPPGFQEEQRGKPHGFVGDPDVMDTWATSSLTPQIISHWGLDDGRHGKVFPMDIRPQSHEIIRTWAFYTIVKAWIHSNEIPWSHVVISGWILDPDRKKMSKSVGNVITPQHLLDEYSADGVRYWASRARLGADTAFDENVMKVGKRLCTKLFNASRFVISQLERVGADISAMSAEQVTCEADRDLFARLRKMVAQANRAFDKFDYAAALEATEKEFWAFCDDYLELVKRRSYGDEDNADRRSALATLALSLKMFLRLFAPFLPFMTEEIWSWRFAEGEGAKGSVHVAPYPTEAEYATIPESKAAGCYAAAVEVLVKIRSAKTEGKKSLRWRIADLKVTGSQESLEALKMALEDVVEAGNVDPSGVQLEVGEVPTGELFTVSAALAEEMPA